MACLYSRPFYCAVEQMLPVSQLKNIGQTNFYALHHKSLHLPLKWQGLTLIQIIFWVDFSQVLC
jgi:hypothetical protein